MNKGDLIRVDWVDITSWPTAAPEDARPLSLHTIGYFAGWFTDKKRGRYLCVSDTICENENSKKEDVFYGANAFPKGCIREISMVKPVRAQKKKKKELKED